MLHRLLTLPSPLMEDEDKAAVATENQVDNGRQDGVGPSSPAAGVEEDEDGEEEEEEDGQDKGRKVRKAESKTAPVHRLLPLLARPASAFALAKLISCLCLRRRRDERCGPSVATVAKGSVGGPSRLTVRPTSPKAPPLKRRPPRRLVAAQPRGRVTSFTEKEPPAKPQLEVALKPPEASEAGPTGSGRIRTRIHETDPKVRRTKDTAPSRAFYFETQQEVDIDF